MSILVTPNEQGMALIRMSQVFTPVSLRELNAWQQDWLNALKSAPYLKVTKVDNNGPFHSMLNIKCVPNYVGINLRMVKNDIERAWEQEVVVGCKGSHFFKETETGLEMGFLGVTEKTNYVTGTILLTLREYL